MDCISYSETEYPVLPGLIVSQVLACIDIYVFDMMICNWYNPISRSKRLDRCCNENDVPVASEVCGSGYKGVLQD